MSVVGAGQLALPSDAIVATQNVVPSALFVKVTTTVKAWDTL